MRYRNILKKIAVIFLIVCAIILAIDLFKAIKITFDFSKLQESTRVSTSSKADEVRYEPTEYIINNKDDALEKIKELTIELKNQHVEKGSNEGLFEIANINKIEQFFYEYKKYAIVKYKLLNVIEDLPNLYQNTKNFTNAQLESYFNNHAEEIDKCYGITRSADFMKFANSIRFLNNGKVKLAIVQDRTIDFDYDRDILKFTIKIIGNNDEFETYFVRVQYYESSDNQVSPYLEIMMDN